MTVVPKEINRFCLRIKGRGEGRGGEGERGRGGERGSRWVEEGTNCTKKVRMK